jgi:hypothetical protein
MSSNRPVRTGVHVTAAPSGCGGCGHPYTLHSNGRTGCKAAGCTGGAAVACPSCNGTTVSLLPGGDCGECGGRGTVPAPCAGFTAGDRAREVPELLAS